MLEVGMKAPQFTLPDKNGKMVSLSDFLGKKVVLYFYPKDNTPGCTRQACAFALKNKEIENKNAVVIGISRDSVNSHLNFATKYNLPFVLLSDSELSAIQAYGVWQEKKLYGKGSMGVVRTTFLIDEQGVIQAIMPKVNKTQSLKSCYVFRFYSGHSGMLRFAISPCVLCPSKCGLIQLRLLLSLIHGYQVYSNNT